MTTSGSDSGRGLSGFLVHDATLTYANRDTSEIVATQANPQPGDPIADADDALLKLQVRGGQDTDLDVYVSRTGMPGIQVGNCRVITKAGAATIWNGYTTADVGQDWQWLDGSSATHPLMDTARIPSSGKVVVVQAHETSAIGADLSAHTWDPSDNSWTTVVIVTSTGSADHFWRDVAICTLPDETLVVMAHSNTAPDNVFTMYYSKDAGATWAVYNTNALPVGAGVGTTANAGRSQMAYSEPDVLWVRQHVGATDTDILQYASTSRGAEFTEVRQWTTTTSAYPAEINVLALPDGRLAMVYLSSSTVISIRRIGSAWEAFEDATAETVQSGGTKIGLAAHVDESGILHVFYSKAGQVFHMESRDIGDTWVHATGHEAMATASGDEPNKIISVSSMGLHFLIGNCNAGTGTLDPHIGAWVFGGWGPGEMRVDESGVNNRQIGILGNYELPHDLNNWVRGGSGGTWSLSTSGYTQLACSAAADYETYTLANGRYDLAVTGAVYISSGGSLTVDAVRLQSGDGVNDLLQTSLRFDRTTDTVRWANGAGAAIEDISHVWSSVGKFVFRIYIDAATDTAYLVYRAGNTIEWTMANSGAGYSMTPIASAITTKTEFGVRSAATVTQRWYFLDTLEGDAAGALHFKTAQADLFGKSLGQWAYPLPGIGPGTEVARLSLSGGPARIGDGYDIDVASSHPLSALYPLDSPSPESPWRSVGTGEEIPLSWDNTYDTRWGDSVAIALLNCNFPTAVLEGQTGGAGWVTIATLNMDEDFEALAFDRTGDMITAAAAGVISTRYMWRNEFAGATVDLGNGDYRKIRKNTAGQWFVGAISVAKPVLWLEGIDGTEDTSGGSCNIWSKNAVAIVHNVSDYDQFRLRIPTGSNADGYWQIGAALIGGLAVIGKQHDWGWKWRTEPNVEGDSNKAGTTFARRLGKVKRSLTMSWNAGYDLSGIREHNTSTALDFLAADAGNPLTVENDVGFYLAGLLEEINSGETPLVVIPYIPDTDAVFTDPWDFLYCRPVGALQMDHVVGDERSDEVYRSGPWTLSEVI